MESVSNTPSLHTYSSLQGPKHIRILILEPSLDSSLPLQCSFKQASLEECEGEYEALSYTWGEPKLTEPLHCSDGTLVSVTKNLDVALRRVRHKVERRLLWADAACINQRDKEEKAVQIPLMVDIFRSAARVLAWLGPSRDVEQGLNTLKHLSRLTSNTALNRTAPMPQQVESITHVLESAYFTRMWIVQEIVFNPDVTLICALSEITWPRFCAAVNISERLDLMAHSPDARQKAKDINSMSELWIAHCSITANKRSYRNEVDTEILDLLDQFGHYNVSDHRDRLFALYSMATDVRSSNRCDAGSRFSHPIHLFDSIIMEVNYNKTALETYEVFAKACLKAGKIRPLLQAIVKRPSSAHAVEFVHLPSWVPDLNIPPDHSIDLFRHFKRPTIRYLESQDGNIKLMVEVHPPNVQKLFVPEPCDPSILVDFLGPHLDDDSDTSVERFFGLIVDLLPEFYFTSYVSLPCFPAATASDSLRNVGAAVSKYPLLEEWLSSLGELCFRVEQPGYLFRDWLRECIHEQWSQKYSTHGAVKSKQHQLFNMKNRLMFQPPLQQRMKESFCKNMKGKRLFRALDSHGCILYGVTQSPLQRGDVILGHTPSFVLRPIVNPDAMGARACHRISAWHEENKKFRVPRTHSADAEGSYRLLGVAQLSSARFSVSPTRTSHEFIDQSTTLFAEFWLG